MKKIFPVLIILVLSQINFAQSKLKLFPNELNIQPFTANQIEPKLGFMFRVNENQLRLDIGNSMDVFHYQSGNTTYSFGADLFTYTLLRSESSFHFPVDAVDYLFGFNFGYRKALCNNNEYGLRFRLSHISAHFVDGHYDGPNQRWLDGRNPTVYSREFIEFMPYYKYDDLKVYVGFTYIFNVDPRSIGKENYQFGAEYFLTDLLTSYLTPYVAYDIKLINIDKVTANNSINIGFKVGNPEGKGFSIFYHYYSGKSQAGEYFDNYEKYSAIGINFDL